MLIREGTLIKIIHLLATRTKPPKPSQILKIDKTRVIPSKTLKTLNTPILRPFPPKMPLVHIAVYIVRGIEKHTNETHLHQPHLHHTIYPIKGHSIKGLYTS
jgi:hypothetical protein